MAGCYGNDPYDRAMEQRLNRYLDDLDKISCDSCDRVFYYDDYLNEDGKSVTCPECGNIIKLL